MITQSTDIKCHCCKSLSIPDNPKVSQRIQKSSNSQASFAGFLRVLAHIWKIFLRKLYKAQQLLLSGLTHIHEVQGYMVWQCQTIYPHNPHNCVTPNYMEYIESIKGTNE